MRLIFTLAFLASSSLLLAQMGFHSPQWTAGLNGVPPTGGTPPAGFDPGDVANLYVRLEPQALKDAGYTNGTLVSNITDSVSSLLWGQDTQSKCPTLTNNAGVNNQKAWLAHDSTDDYMTNYGVLIPQPFTVFMYMNPTRTAGAARYFWKSALANGAFVLLNASSILRYDSPTTIDVVTNTALAGSWWLYEFTFNGGSSTMFTNGVEVTPDVAKDPGTNWLGHMAFSASEAGGSVSGESLAALLIYSNNVAAGDRTSLRNWFKTNYAAPLP